MPKLKTRRSVAKRIRLTATGKLKRAQANRRHLLSHRSSKRKRRLSHNTLVSAADTKQIKRLIPWG